MSCRVFSRDYWSILKATFEFLNKRLALFISFFVSREVREVETGFRACNQKLISVLTTTWGTCSFYIHLTLLWIQFSICAWSLGGHSVVCFSDAVYGTRGCTKQHKTNSTFCDSNEIAWNNSTTTKRKNIGNKLKFKLVGKMKIWRGKVGEINRICGARMEHNDNVFH